MYRNIIIQRKLFFISKCINSQASISTNIRFDRICSFIHKSQKERETHQNVPKLLIRIVSSLANPNNCQRKDINHTQPKPSKTNPTPVSQVSRMFQDSISSWFNSDTCLLHLTCSMHVLGLSPSELVVHMGHGYSHKSSCYQGIKL